MDAAPRDARAAAQDDEETVDPRHPLRHRLRSSGYRVTPQRQFVLEAVVQLGHATPDAIAAAVAAKVPGISLSTVYRTLEVLEDIGVVRHVHLGHGAPTYHPADESDHLHLVCSSCDWVGEVPVETAAALADRLHDERGFVTDMAHFALYGTCAACAAAGVGAVDQPGPAVELPETELPADEDAREVR